LTGTEPAFEAALDALEEGVSLTINLDGFEGPLDLLLTLARAQKVDLARIALIPLVDQYLAFVEEAKGQRIDLAAEYLVMAAWLTLLKSRLLFPKPAQDTAEPDAETIASHLQQKLMRLAEARAAAAQLNLLAHLDRDVFLNGAPIAVKVENETRWTATLYNLMSAYTKQRAKGLRRTHQITLRRVYPLEAARHQLEGALPDLAEWRALRSLRPPIQAGPEAPELASFDASLFGATLELVRDQRLEAQQEGLFAPLFVRRRRRP
jgi:segregation and condensation protein A